MSEFSSILNVSYDHVFDVLFHVLPLLIFSDLCLQRMEREIQTQRNEIPEAKVGLYT